MGHGAWRIGHRVEKLEIAFLFFQTLCSLPHALCSLLDALCAMPYAMSAMLYSLPVTVASGLELFD
jgi:hypothetical protein